jgi:hypothetical protein
MFGILSIDPLGLSSGNGDIYSFLVNLVEMRISEATSLLK